MLSHADFSIEDLGQYEIQSKGMSVAYVLWLFLGWLGAHHFYTGKKRKGRLYVAFFMLMLTALILIMYFGEGLEGVSSTTMLIVGPLILAGALAAALWCVMWLVDAFFLYRIVRRHNEAVLKDLLAGKQK